MSAVGRSFQALVGLLCGLLPYDVLAGGFDNEQSTYFQGMSLAGLAAGGSSVSSIFWNPAAAAFADPGFTVESSFALILPTADMTVLNPEQQLPPPGTDKVDIGRDVLTAASFATKRVNDKTVLGLSMSSPFGLGTEPDDPNWSGKYHALTTKLFTLNVTPSMSYQVAPWLAVGPGVQVEYLNIIKIKAATPLGLSTLKQDDWNDNLGVGFTAGINVSPTPWTSIGVGYRSAIHHDIEGETTVRFNSTAALLGLTGKAKAPNESEIELPQKVTLGVRQVVSPASRLLGTVIWTDWTSLGDAVSVVLEGPLDGLASAGVPIANFEFGWRDAWWFALGGEYDWSPKLTLRTGMAYEISPVHSATTRPVQLPDSNKFWASVGASYKWNDNMSLDFAYMHAFYEDDAPFDRIPASALLPPVHLIGKANVDVDIVAVGFKIRWGGPAPASRPLK